MIYFNGVWRGCQFLTQQKTCSKRNKQTQACKMRILKNIQRHIESSSKRMSSVIKTGVIPNTNKNRFKSFQLGREIKSFQNGTDKKFSEQNPVTSQYAFPIKFWK